MDLKKFGFYGLNIKDDRVKVDFVREERYWMDANF